MPTPRDVSRIVFIGGPSRIPLIRKLVSEELNIPADLDTDPMTAVAIGAAHYCERPPMERQQCQLAKKPTQAAITPLPGEEPGLVFGNTLQRTPDEKNHHHRQNWKRRLKRRVFCA